MWEQPARVYPGLGSEVAVLPWALLSPLELAVQVFSRLDCSAAVWLWELSKRELLAWRVPALVCHQ